MTKDNIRIGDRVEVRNAQSYELIDKGVVKGKHGGFISLWNSIQSYELKADNYTIEKLSNSHVPTVCPLMSP